MSDDQEPARPEPDFRVYVERGNNTVDVTHAVQDVYDVAVNSLDFGSGFLSTEEVGNLRALGAAIGAKRFDYQHDKCLRCGHDCGSHFGVDKSGGCGAEGFARTEEGRLDITKPVCPCAGFIRPT